MTTTTTTAANTTSQFEMVFTCGLPAAGKSYVVARDFASYTSIDPDAVKEAHPDYDPKNPAALHAWSQQVTEQLFADALANADRDYVVDGTGTNAEKMVRRMKAAAAAGYRTRLVFVTCTLETSLRRNAARARVVPESIIREKALDITTAFEIIREYADAVQIIENN